MGWMWGDFWYKDVVLKKFRTLGKDLLNFTY